MRAVAIDGPAGAGKSTIAKLVSKKLNYIYVDTGAMYRAIGLYLIKNNISADDEKGIDKAIADADISIDYIDSVQHVYIDGEDVTGKLRTEQVGNMASSCSVYLSVREKLVSLQRDIAKKQNVVMDGRDIATKVLPNADTKIYLTASVDTRAERRYKELKEKNTICDIETIKKDIEDRDYRDMHRKNSPLVQAEDAMLIDSSNMSIDEVVDKILELVKKEN